MIASNIQPKMITGDNIYIAIETAIRAGILPPGKVLLMEGKRQNQQGQWKGIVLDISTQKSTQINIE